MELVTRPEQQQSQQHQQNQSQQQHHQRHHQSPIRKGGGGGGGGSGGYSRTSGQSNQSVVFQRGGGSKKAKHSVHWFRKGLRLMDNPALLRAVRNCDTWRCIFILDPWSAGSSNQVWSHLRSSIRSSTLQSMMNAKLSTLNLSTLPQRAVVASCRSCLSKIPFSWQHQNLWGLSLAFVKDLRVVALIHRKGTFLGNFGIILRSPLPWQC